MIKRAKNLTERLTKKTREPRLFGNMRFFIFSSSTMRFKEVHFFKAKLAGMVTTLALVVLGLILAGNYYSSDVLGLGYDRMSMLTAENKLLKDQFRDLSKKMSLVQKSLETLSERGNELRLLVDLTKIDDETRSASIGGSQASMMNTFLSSEAGNVLNESQKLIDKLDREVRLQQASYQNITKQLEYNKGFFAHLPAIKPMNGYYSINGFGMRIHPVLHVYKMHEGIDIANDVGTPIYAAGDGEIRFAGRTQGGYGMAVEIVHGYGYSSWYAHLSQTLVHPGQKVHRGELIAKSGRSGLVSGPHLHFEVRHNGRKQNPVDYFFDDIDAAKYRAQLAQGKMTRGE